MSPLEPTNSPAFNRNRSGSNQLPLIPELENIVELVEKLERVKLWVTTAKVASR